MSLPWYDWVYLQLLRLGHWLEGRGHPAQFQMLVPGRFFCPQCYIDRGRGRDRPTWRVSYQPR